MTATITTTDTTNVAIQINGVNKLVIGGSSQLGIGGTNYGAAGQVLTSGGPSTAPTWSTISLTNYVLKDNNSAIGLSGIAVWGGTSAPSVGSTVSGSSLYLIHYSTSSASLGSGTWRIAQVGGLTGEGPGYTWTVLAQRIA